MNSNLFLSVHPQQRALGKVSLYPVRGHTEKSDGETSFVLTHIIPAKTTNNI